LENPGYNLPNHSHTASLAFVTTLALTMSMSDVIQK